MLRGSDSIEETSTTQCRSLGVCLYWPGTVICHRLRGTIARRMEPTVFPVHFLKRLKPERVQDTLAENRASCALPMIDCPSLSRYATLMCEQERV